jgi:hypothetical protein
MFCFAKELSKEIDISHADFLVIEFLQTAAPSLGERVVVNAEKSLSKPKMRKDLLGLFIGG